MRTQGLARIIHEISFRNRQVALRNGPVQPRTREAYRGPFALPLQRVDSRRVHE